VPEGKDASVPSAAASNANNSFIGIGNAYLSDYSVEMAVGAIPTVNVSFDALNIRAADTTVGLPSPAINPVDGSKVAGIQTLPNTFTGSGDIAALRPGNITVDISSFNTSGVANIGTTADGAHIQSASLSVPMSRSTLERLGSKSAYARSVDFPIVATLSVSAIFNDVETTNLVDIIADESEKNVDLTLNDEDGLPAVRYHLKGCSLDSQSISSSIGSNKTVDLTFSTSVGGPSDTTHGVFMSGVSDAAPNNAPVQGEAAPA